MGEVRKLAVTTALAAALACSACAGGNAAAEPAASLEGAHYVAMGSSFAAGAGIGPIQDGTPERCNRTQNNYASLLAQDLGLDLDDQSCGGATTAHLLEAWDELPAQIDAVTADTRIVTITVGGNDLNYMGLLFTASCDAETGMVIDGETVACPPRVHLPEADAYTQTADALGGIVREIHSRAPDAVVIFVQYVSLVPQQPCAATPLDETAMAEARELASRLAGITAQASMENGALVLSADQLSANHTACDAESWARGFDPEYDGSQGAPWHPTAAGHAAIARELVTMLES